MRPTRLAATLALTLAAASCGGASRRGAVAARPADPAHRLSRDAVREDLARLDATLRTALATRAFTTPETWHSFETELAAVATREHDPSTLCDAIAGVLTRLIEPSLYATLGAEGTRCRGSESTAGGLPSGGQRAGANIATGANALFAVRESSGVTVLGIARFEPTSAPGWNGLPAALDAAARAPALVLDLRGATGSDPSTLLPLVASLTGRGALRPLRSIVRPTGPAVDALRAAYVAQPGHATPRSLEIWRSLVGDAEGIDVGGPLAVTRPVRVLIDRECGEACELIARMLQAYAGAMVFGAVSSEHRMTAGEPGLLVLPRSGVRVYLPTAAYEVSPRIARVTGDRGSWFDRRTWNADAQPAAAGDVVAGMVSSARELLDTRARMARWAQSPPRACAEFAAFARPEDLPAEARARLQGYYSDRERLEITATLDLPPEQATAFVAGCPGLQASGAFGQDGSTVWVHTASFAALSRLLQSDVIRRVSVRPEPHYELNAR